MTRCHKLVSAVLCCISISAFAGAGAATPAPAGAAKQALVAPDVPSGKDSARDTELAKRAAGFIDAFSNSDPVLSPDGKRMVFVSNRDGLPQLYVGDPARPSAPATRLLHWPERMNGAVITPDGEAILFRSDKGADENWAVYRVGFDGKAPVELTSGKLNRDGIIVVDGAPGTFFFSARDMREARSTVYSAPARAPGPAKALYTSDRPGGLTDVSRDGKRGLFVEFPSNSENHLMLVDFATGKAKELYPVEGKVSVHDAMFSADGKRVFVATDAGKEAALLLAMDASTGKELARYTERKPANAEVVGVSVSKKGDRLALGLLAGNHHEVRLLHARTLKPTAKVQLPLGRGFPRDFSDDGRRLTLTWSTPGTPTDVFAIDSRTGKVSPLRSDARPTLKGLPVIETSLAEVKGFDGTVIPVHVYRQKGDKGTRRPVIVSYHGGPAGTSTIGWSPMAAFFVAQGYVWVEPNVRGSGGFGRAFEEADNGPRRLDAFKDIEASSRWAASQPWADKDRVVIYGGSYGGYTTLIGLTRFPELYRAGVNLFGVANLKTFMASTSGLIREVFHLEFGHPEKDAAFLDSISPLKDTGKIQDPLFVYAGANDPRVPRAESDLIVSAVRRSKVPVEYMVKDNEGHSLARRENQMEFYARMARFLQTHLASANAPDTQAQQSQ